MVFRSEGGRRGSDMLLKFVLLFELLIVLLFVFLFLVKCNIKKYFCGSADQTIVMNME